MAHRNDVFPRKLLSVRLRGRASAQDPPLASKRHDSGKLGSPFIAQGRAARIHAAFTMGVHGRAVIKSTQMPHAVGQKPHGMLGRILPVQQALPAQRVQRKQ